MFVAVECLRPAQLQAFGCLSVAISEFAILHEIENAEFRRKFWEALA
jgi:hypothetical protein